VPKPGRFKYFGEKDKNCYESQKELGSKRIRQRFTPAGNETDENQKTRCITFDTLDNNAYLL
jgi:hypothetical protein